ncbi:MAG: serine/threonine protein kinase [Acidobacteriota bacterium]
MARRDRTNAAGDEAGLAESARPASLLGKTIHSIKLVELLGSGGMGEVYLGVDQRLERRVAVKALRGERRVQPHARARVLREARMLSALDHPNICRLFEFIEEEDGDYLVLELISGRDLRAYLQEKHTFAEKLRVARGVAEALVAAHGLSVVHRDLKPENVMVTPDGSVKVLDFGLARPLLDGGVDHSLDRAPDAPPCEQAAATLTALGAIMGTPRTMSPEQARGEPVTAASDMYSFGLLLQELFTGRPAVDPSQPVAVMLQRAMWGETEPVRGLPAPLTTLIERLKSLQPHLRPSAQATAEALRRIADAPRRRLRTALALVLAATLAGAAVVSSVGFLQARRAQRRAEAAERAARQAQGEAEAVNRFLREMLASADPRGLGREVKVVEVLDRAGAAVSSELVDAPLVEAGVRLTLGGTYLGLGQYPAAREQLGRARELFADRLGEMAPDTLRADTALGLLTHAEGREREAEKLLREVMRRQIQAVGPAHPDLLATILAWSQARSSQREYGEIVAMLERTLPRWRRTLGEDHRETLNAQYTLGRALVDDGQFRRADAILRDCLTRRRRTLGETHPDTATTYFALAASAGYQQRFVEAEEYQRQGLAIARVAWGEEHPRTLQAESNLVWAVANQRRHAEALALARPLIEVEQRVLGPGHPATLGTMRFLGASLLELGRTEEGLRVYQERVALARRYLGEDHRLTLEAQSNLANAFRDLDRPADAERIFRQVLALRQKAFGPDHLFTQRAARNLAAALRDQGRIREAEKLEERLDPEVIREGFRGHIYRRFPPPQPPPADK